jgi:glutathione S-transferase
MTFEYVSVEDAINRDGLRMVVVGGVPSPWGEAAKGIFHIKQIDWAAVRLVYDNDALDQWAGEQTGPVAIYNNEPPRSGWSEILLLAERLNPTPSLIPANAGNRARMFSLAHEICGEAGLGWSRRLQLIHRGLQGDDGFPQHVAQYLRDKYGHTSAAGEAAGQRVEALLDLLVSSLRVQQETGSHYHIGDSVTAVDVYSATFTTLFAPLPPEHCEMHPGSRAAFETLDARTQAALDPILLEHRDMMYEKHLQLPLSL